MPKPHRKPWKTAADVRRLSFSKGSAGGFLRIGGNSDGIVFAGKVKFGKGGPQRVAIKFFVNPMGDKYAGRYQTVIDDLRSAGVPLPKMAMYKIKAGDALEQAMPSSRNLWVLVSQLFGSKKGSKLVPKSWLDIKTPEGREDAVRTFTRVANAGYVPSADLIEPFRDPSRMKRTGVVPIDLHKIVKAGKGSFPRYNADFLRKLILTLAREADERRHLFDVAKGVSTREIREILKETEF